MKTYASRDRVSLNCAIIGKIKSGRATTKRSSLINIPLRVNGASKHLSICHNKSAGNNHRVSCGNGKNITEAICFINCDIVKCFSSINVKSGIASCKNNRTCAFVEGTSCFGEIRVSATVYSAEI